MTAKVVLGVLGAIALAGAGFGLQMLIGPNDAADSSSEVAESELTDDNQSEIDPTEEEQAESEQAMPPPSDGVEQTGGFEYETDRFSVLFPGEPTASEVDNPNADEQTQLVSWTGDKVTYEVSYVPKRIETLTLEDSVTTGVEATGGTLVELQKGEVAGGASVLGIGEFQGEQFWVMSVFVDDSDEQFILFQSGGGKDEAFFNSFKLK